MSSTTPLSSKTPPTIEGLALSIKDKFNNSLIKWWRREGRDYAWRRKDISPYEVLVAEVLLKRTTATAAEKTYSSLLDMCPDIPSLANVDEVRLEGLLANVGLQKQRAKGLKEIAHYVLEEEEGKIPRSLDKLLRIPHVGDYAARAILSFGFRLPYGVVDSNVMRVLSSVFRNWLHNRTSLQTYQMIVDILLPRRRHREFNWAILDLGAMKCHYTRRTCSQCPLRLWCDTYGVSSPAPVS